MEMSWLVLRVGGGGSQSWMMVVEMGGRSGEGERKIERDTLFIKTLLNIIVKRLIHAYVSYTLPDLTRKINKVRAKGHNVIWFLNIKDVFGIYKGRG